MAEHDKNYQTIFVPYPIQDISVKSS